MAPPDPDTLAIPVAEDLSWDAPEPPPTDLPEEDGIPMESEWHRLAMMLLLASVYHHFRDHPRFHAGGNTFIYFSPQQTRNQDFRGPDFFFVWDVERDRLRRYWAVWDEGGKYPNLIIELTSPSTASVDRTTKKAIYESVFHTREYFLYDPDTRLLEGYRLGASGTYEPIQPGPDGRLWSTVLELFLGAWEGDFLTRHDTYLRFFDAAGNLVLTGEEDMTQHAADEKRRADDEKRRADDEKRRAENAEAELARLRARMAELESPPTASPAPSTGP